MRLSRFIDAILLPCSVLAALFASAGPGICQTQDHFPLRVRGSSGLAVSYEKGAFIIEFQPAAQKAEKGLQPGEGSWADRALNRNEPHTLKQTVTQDEAQFMADYLQNSDHYATFYCTNTGQGYLEAAGSEPYSPPAPPVIKNPEPGSSVGTEGAQTGDEPPMFSAPEVTNFLKEYAQITQEYITAIKAMNSGDSSRILVVTDKVVALVQQVPKIAALLKPDEVKKFQTYLKSYQQKLNNAR